jgi:curved DNA-binding protein CbpA
LLFVLATQAAEDFRKISEAYERLSDESLRRAYDSAWMQMRAGVGAKELSVEDFFFLILYTGAGGRCQSYSGSVKALLRRYEGSRKALLRGY